MFYTAVRWQELYEMNNVFTLHNFIVGYPYAKNYQSWWKSNKVMIKTFFIDFFIEARCIAVSSICV